MIDIVTVVHRESNKLLADKLQRTIGLFEKPGTYTFTVVDNRLNNRGFACGSNLGASQGSSDIILFLNPDVEVLGAFLDLLLAPFESPRVVIAGERFGKPREEIEAWGCHDWVCGACFAVRRDWFEHHGGFWPEYFLFFEETDLIRQAQAEGKLTRSIHLPVTHRSPDQRTDPDVDIKRRYMQSAYTIYKRRWPANGA